MLREVRLYGHLGKRFGRVHRFDVGSPAEAVAALRANFPAFDWHVLAHEPAPCAAAPAPETRPQLEPLCYWESGTVGGGN